MGKTRGDHEENTRGKIKSRAEVVFAGIVGVRREIAGAAGITVRVVQRIVAKKGKLCPHSNTAVHDELVLPENPVRLVLEDIALIRQGTLSVVRRIGRVDIVGEKRVDTARVQVRYREICGLAKLALHAHTGLPGIWRSQMCIP